MALSIRNPETDRLARELADATGETITEAISNALKERLERVRPAQSEEDIERKMAEARALIDEFQKHFVGPVVSDDEIYDEFGDPREG